MKSISDLKEQAVLRYGHQKLEWHFIPAAVPHMGGLWEAGVKSSKTNLKNLGSDQTHLRGIRYDSGQYRIMFKFSPFDSFF